MNKIFLKLINLVKVTLDKLLPSFPAIGSRIYKPYFSPDTVSFLIPSDIINNIVSARRKNVSY